MADLQPIDPKARIEILDILRGFALLGILFNNILYFSGYTFQPFDVLSARTTFQLDEKLYWVLDLVITAKFYTLFSILFAAGFYLQMSRHQEDEATFLNVYKRRLTILLVIGLLHSLIWFGDILLLYALIGLVLVRFRNLSGKRLLRAALLLLLLPTVIDIAGLVFATPAVVTESLAHAEYPDMSPQAVMVAFKDGNIVDLFSLNIHHLVWKWLSYIPSGRILVVFGVFLLGYYLASIEFFNKRARSMKLLAVSFLIGLATTVTALELGGSMYRFPPTPVDAAHRGLLTVGQIALCFFYVTSIALLLHARMGARMLRYLQSVGRMALTNYISQTLICILIFYNFGLNLIGELGLIYVVTIAIVVLMVQTILSNLWLKYFRYGPLEWIWRSLTYRKRIAMR
jgi:uncharacterized protein